jgi:hypothetical protein
MRSHQKPSANIKHTLSKGDCKKRKDNLPPPADSILDHLIEALDLARSELDALSARQGSRRELRADVVLGIAQAIDARLMAIEQSARLD